MTRNVAVRGGLNWPLRATHPTAEKGVSPVRLSTLCRIKQPRPRMVTTPSQGELAVFFTRHVELD